MDLENTKKIFEILAIFCVGAYFLMQVLFGSFVVSMELTPNISSTFVEGNHFYHISLELKRGGYGAINLHNIYYRVIDVCTEKILIDFTEFKHFEKLDFDKFEAVNEKMRMPPGEKLTFSEGFYLENSNPIKVDFVVKAKKNFGLSISQWRSNSIFVPKTLTTNSTGIVANRAFTIR